MALGGRSAVYRWRAVYKGYTVRYNKPQATDAPTDSMHTRRAAHGEWVQAVRREVPLRLEELWAAPPSAQPRMRRQRCELLLPQARRSSVALTFPLRGPPPLCPTEVRPAFGAEPGVLPPDRRVLPCESQLFCVLSSSGHSHSRVPALALPLHLVLRWSVGVSLTSGCRPVVCWA